MTNTTRDVMVKAFEMAKAQLDNYKQVEKDWPAEDQTRAACILVFNSNNEVLAVSRRGFPTEFGLPGGKVDDGETYLEAAIRELEEETGLVLTPEDLDPICSGDDGHGFDVTTYICKRDIDVNAVSQQEQDIVVAWVDSLALVEGPFGDYNRTVMVSAANYTLGSGW